MNAQMRNPAWWTENHTRGWDRVKEAFRRDWEQTKADLSGRLGQDLDQQVGDTLKQAVGSEQIPPPGQMNHATDFVALEPAYRYGYGARLEHGQGGNAWNDELEDRLEAEWFALGAKEPWAEAEPHVRRGWDAVES